jgi:hypothetical protein
MMPGKVDIPFGKTFTTKSLIGPLSWLTGGNSILSATQYFTCRGLTFASPVIPSGRERISMRFIGYSNPVKDISPSATLA